ncbi:CoA-binding protein [Lichenibacterium ramalinae]|uniref:CoA-binding protein n=1 Tax=Lichenibacterium ramalinae TaxID=2316527 RepID=A0A4Q2RE12_9HYPH|nr:CoA-binding protein [Lichenibacterium ramalinae]
MPERETTDAVIAAILRDTRTIALVGASADPARPSFGVMHFLSGRGYRVFPVNPGLAGGTIQGRRVYGRLADLPEPVDMVDVFRKSEAAGAVVDDALALAPPPRTVWMQIGVRDDAAAARAQAAGVTVVMDRCPKIEYRRLLGDAG